MTIASELTLEDSRIDTLAATLRVCAEIRHSAMTERLRDHLRMIAANALRQARAAVDDEKRQVPQTAFTPARNWAQL